MYRRALRNLPIINFFVSSAALSFQMFVLNPWHKRISDELDMVMKRVIETGSILGGTTGLLRKPLPPSRSSDN